MMTPMVMTPFVKVTLILAGSLVVTGLALWLTHRRGDQPGADAPGTVGGEAPSADDGCCGMHMTCEKDSLLASVSQGIEYYDDEELDAYAGRGADDYEGAEIEEFRDVLLTLRPDDIAGWARSVQLRGITLPAEVREELLMIVAEAREARTQNAKNE